MRCVAAASIPEAVNEEHTKPGDCSKSFFAPLDNVTGCHYYYYNRSGWPALAMNLDRRERNDRLAGAAFCDGGGGGCRLSDILAAITTIRWPGVFIYRSRIRLKCE
jgi:hypothetical protein